MAHLLTVLALLLAALESSEPRYNRHSSYTHDHPYIHSQYTYSSHTHDGWSFLPSLEGLMNALRSLNPFHGRQRFLISGTTLQSVLTNTSYLWWPPYFGSLALLGYCIVAGLSKELISTANQGRRRRYSNEDLFCAFK